MGESIALDNDLRENPEFMQLRTEVNYVLPRKLEEINGIIKSCKIIEETREYVEAKFDKAQLGAKVTVQYDDGTVIPFTILGYDEGDLDTNTISYLSPIARGLFGKRAGDRIEIKTPDGIIKVEILSVEKGILCPR